MTAHDRDFDCSVPPAQPQHRADGRVHVVDGHGADRVAKQVAERLASGRRINRPAGDLRVVADAVDRAFEFPHVAAKTGGERLQDRVRGSAGLALRRLLAKDVQPRLGVGRQQSPDRAAEQRSTSSGISSSASRGWQSVVTTTCRPSATSASNVWRNSSWVALLGREEVEVVEQKRSEHSRNWRRNAPILPSCDAATNRVVNSSAVT